MTAAVRSTSRDYVGAANYDLVPGGRHAAVILLHGLGGDLNQVRNYTAGMISGRAATRLGADARQHGFTQLRQPGPMTFDVLADDIVALSDALALPSDRILVGVSMGAGTALRVALRRPERVRGLVLIRPAWLQHPKPPNLAAMTLIAELIRQHGTSRGRERFRTHPVYLNTAVQSPSAAASLLEQFEKPWAAERSGRLIEMPACTPFTDPAELAAIDVPTLVIGAPQDPMHPLHVATTWADNIPGASYAELTARDIDPRRYAADLQAVISGFLTNL